MEDELKAEVIPDAAHIAILLEITSPLQSVAQVSLAIRFAASICAQYVEIKFD